MRIKRTKFKAIKCQLCGKEFLRITNTHLWKEHQITMEEYKRQFPKAPIDAKGLAYNRVAHLRDKTYGEVYEEEKTERLKQIRSENATSQMKNEEQIQIRHEKCGYEQTEEHKKHLSVVNMKHGGMNYRKRALEYYGLECARCGKTTQNPSDFVVHHKDLLNIPSELGNHELDNLSVLCKSCHAKLHNEITTTQNRFTGLSSIEKGMHYILKGLKDDFGLDLQDVNFKDTPKRVARAYAEIFAGVKETDQQIEEILSTAFPSKKYNSLIFCPDILTFSMCPHHFLPVEYTTAIGYIPTRDGQVLGASKLGRLVEVLSQRPVLQETFTKDIVDAMNTVKPEGVAVVVSGIHYCMRMRGIKKITTFETSEMSGVFMSDPSSRKEFFDLLALSKQRR